MNLERSEILRVTWLRIQELWNVILSFGKYEYSTVREITVFCPERINLTF